MKLANSRLHWALSGIVNSGTARSFGFTTTPTNLITSKAEGIGGATQRTWSYGYDLTDRLTLASINPGAPYTYGYDGASNLTQINGVAVAYDTVNRITSRSGTAYSYDANGNLLDDGQRTYTWDAENRLVGVQPRQGYASTFRYDGLGRRLMITDANVMRFVWCGDKLCQMRDGSDTVIRRYFDEGVVAPQQSALVYGVDQLGSVRDLMPAQGGAPVASYDYDPYGNLTAQSGSAASEFGYGMLYRHVPSSLQLANYRAYDAQNGRWASRDPLGLAAGVNLYAYVSGNPIKYIDPSGLAGVLPGPIPVPIPGPASPIPRKPKDDGSNGGMFPPGTMPTPINPYGPNVNTERPVPQPQPPLPPEPPGSGCRAVFDLCLRGAKICPTPVKQGVYAICLALYFSCQAAGGHQ